MTLLYILLYAHLTISMLCVIIYWILKPIHTNKLYEMADIMKQTYPQPSNTNATKATTLNKVIAGIKIYMAFFIPLLNIIWLYSIIYTCNIPKDVLIATAKNNNKISNRQLTPNEQTVLNTEYEYAETCPHCGYENNSTIIPLTDVTSTCKNCGKTIIICDLCDRPYGCNQGINKDFCKKSIHDTLLNNN